MFRATTLSLLACATFAAAQTPFVRPSQRVDLNTTGFGVLPGVASGGNLSAVIWADRNGGTAIGTQRVSVTMSDGRGLDWAAPVRIDSDPGTVSKLTQNDSVAIVGTNVYAVWSDERSGAAFDDLYFNRSTDGGVNWAGEQRLSVGIAPGVAAVRDYAMVAVEPDMVYVLMAVDPNTTSNEQLYLASSIGGLPFTSTPIYTGPNDVDEVAIAADALGRVYVTFVAGAVDDVFYARSTNFGASFGPVVQIDTAGVGVGSAGAGNLQIAAEDPVVAIAFLDKFTSSTNDEIRVAVSIDNGATFGTDAKVGGYTAGTDDVDFMTLGVAGLVIHVGYSDGALGAKATSSATLGVTWRPDTVLSTALGPTQPRFAGSGMDAGYAYWEGPSATANAGAAYTTDGGANWTTDVRLSTDPLDVDFVELSYNSLYRNFVSVWQQDNGARNRLDVGGFRTPTCEAVGFGAGPAMSHFEFRAFNPAHPIGWALLAVTPGPLPLFFLGDPRDIGLTPDALFAASGAAPAIFSTALIGGNGSTTPFATNLTSGFSIVFAGVGIDLPNGFGDLADVRRITVP